MPTFLARRSGGKVAKSPRDGQESDEPILPSLGYATRGGEKHAQSEDRVFTSTLAAVLGAGEDELSFSQALGINPDELLPENVLVAGVFDGHGGTSCVDFVAENLCDRIAKSLPSDGKRLHHLEQAMMEGFEACDEEFMRLAQESNNNSGCCALMAFVHETELVLGWVGDCRAVFYDGFTAKQLTTDHRADQESEFKRITDLGGDITNNRINGVLSPSRCFGDRDIRLKSNEGVLISEPSILTISSLKPVLSSKRNAFLILATDGVWDVLTNQEACEIVLRALKLTNYNPETAALRLVEAASSLTADDVSVCVLTWSSVPWDVYSGIARESYLSDEGDKR
jgi:serine/threonine protein phosphatase PrpC